MAYANYIKFLQGETVKYTDFTSEKEYQEYLGLVYNRK